ncbi:MAG: biotin--[acetyl-CoA-carboxylase] ligase [Terrimicrobiaceae bacterium]|nr:biotin--[acetyl-CoA-carboxylase] ligase [Terrimicrobiaceae bacterium]
MSDLTDGLELTNSVGRAGWRLFVCSETRSTNDIARALHPWNAVRAGVQSSGRGRFGRQFVSNRGGLWLSAVLPADGPPAQWSGFSLMVGVHLVRMLEAWSVPGARLRWPNDLMAGRKKLGGLLIEQAVPGSWVVGFGLNVSNAPWETDPDLEPIATSLARELPLAPSIDEATVCTLDALADAHDAMESGGMAAAIAELNERWREPVPVEIRLSGGGVAHGRFLGLDAAGNLRIRGDQDFLVGHQSVERLVELI